MLEDMKSLSRPSILLGLVLGIAAGVGAYTFAYAKGWSYLTDNAAACALTLVGRHQAVKPLVA